MLSAAEDSEGLAYKDAIDIDQQFPLAAIGRSYAVGLRECDRLAFARQILLWLVIVTVFAFGCYILAPENKGAEQVFELIKVGVLPLVTLVIGFYFPNNRR